MDDHRKAAPAVLDPFAIHGPTNISFSGGRTSGYLLRRAIDAGALRSGDAQVIFANTGKENEATLRFVDRVEHEWGVPVRWLEYVTPLSGDEGAPSSFREVTFETASRHGEPFEALITHRGFVPNMGAPFCTSELKHRVMRHYLTSLGWSDWTSLIGIRFDEKRRWKSRGTHVEGGRVEMPLVDARVTLAEVNAFWRAQPFDLELEAHEGNCDACFKKAGWKVKAIVGADPSRADWWAEQERRTATRFRIDRPGYGAMADVARRQLPLVFDDGPEDDMPCGCAA